MKTKQKKNKPKQLSFEDIHRWNSARNIQSAACSFYEYRSKHSSFIISWSALVSLIFTIVSILPLYTNMHVKIYIYASARFVLVVSRTGRRASSFRGPSSRPRTRSRWRGQIAAGRGKKGSGGETRRSMHRESGGRPRGIICNALPANVPIAARFTITDGHSLLIGHFLPPPSPFPCAPHSSHSLTPLGHLFFFFYFSYSSPFSPLS